MTYYNKLMLIILFTSITSCKSIDVRGQFVNDAQVDEINMQKPNRAKLEEMIGTPTYVPEYSNNTWYYIQRSMTRQAWFEPKVIKQRIVKITLEKDKVSGAQILDDLQNEDIATHSTFTETHGTKQGGLEKFVANIGRFNKNTDGVRKRKKK